MDQLNLQTMVNLTGGYGEDLERNITTLKKYGAHFLNCVVPAWDKIQQPDYPSWQAAELSARRKRAPLV